jgi:hypothetical protein
MRDEYQRGQQTVIGWICEGVAVLLSHIRLDAIYANIPLPPASNSIHLLPRPKFPHILRT